MKLQSSTQKVIEKLEEWQREGKLVVGVDGYSGIGKTTLCNHIAEIYPPVEVLSMDDYVTTANIKDNLLPQITSGLPTLTLEWKPEGGIIKLRQAIQVFRDSVDGKKNLLVEGIFLYHPDLDDVWDRRIYLGGDFEQADARRIKREKERWGDKYFPETHPDSYARLFKIAHKRYEELCHPKEHSDLIIQME